MGESEVSSLWFSEHLSYDDSREVRDPDETLNNYSEMLIQIVSELRRRSHDREDEATRNFMRWMASQIHNMVRVSEQSNFICLFENGPLSISGREYKDGMMYSRVPIGIHNIIFFDEAISSFVPSDFPEDLMPGFADSNQLFFVDKREGVALSANQTILGLLQGGSIDPYSRQEADLERRLKSLSGAS